MVSNRSKVQFTYIPFNFNTETLDCKFITVEPKISLWWASLCCTTQFTLTWFHFSQELSPLARSSLPWQNPQRLDFPFIWLWFTRPFWPSSPFTFFYNKYIDPRVKCRDHSQKKGGYSKAMAGSRIKHIRGSRFSYFKLLLKANANTGNAEVLLKTLLFNLKDVCALSCRAALVELAHSVLWKFLPLKWFSFFPNEVRDQINQNSNFSLEYSPRSDKKKRRKLVLVIIAAECAGIPVQAINKPNIKPKELRAVLYGVLRATRGQKNDFTVTGMRGINHIVYECGETPLYTDKSDTQSERPSSPTSESNQAQPLLILLFITTRLSMWQLSCRGLSPVDYKSMSHFNTNG